MAATSRVQIDVSFQYEATFYVSATSGGSATTPVSILQPPPVTSVSIVDANTGDPVTVYQTETGTATITNLQTDANGNVNGWVVEGFYEITAAPSGSFTGATIYWSAVRGDGVENVAAGAINSTQIVNGAVGSAQLASAVTQGLIPTGTILEYGGSTPPPGFLFCNGSIVSQTTYAALYAVIGTTFNTGGEGAGNFRLPDFRGNFALGKADSGTGSLVGGMGGQIDHTHTIPELTVIGSNVISNTVEIEVPPHSHTVTGVAAAIDLEKSPDGRATLNWFRSKHPTLTFNYQTKGFSDLVDAPVENNTTETHAAVALIGEVDGGGGGTFTGTMAPTSTEASNTLMELTGTANPPYLVVHKMIKT